MWQSTSDSAARRRRPGYLGLALVVISLASFALAVFAALGGALPGAKRVIVVAAPAEVVIRARYVGTRTPVSIELKNLSGSPVRVVGAAVSCTCLVARSDFPMTIPARGSQWLEFDLDVWETATAGSKLGDLFFFVEANCAAVQARVTLGQEL